MPVSMQTHVTQERQGLAMLSDAAELAQRSNVAYALDTHVVVNS